MTSRAFALALLAASTASAACGSANVSESSFDDPSLNDASSTGDTSTTTTDTSTPPTDDTSTDPPKKDGDPPGEDTAKPDTGAPLSLDNVCNRLADATCTAAFSSCCGTKGFSYKEAGCRAAVNASCAAQVKEIKGGKGTFNAAAFPACVSAWNALATKCSVPILEFLKTYTPCDQLLNGNQTPGNSCGEDWQCKAAEGTFANCGREGRCESIAIVGSGAACVYGGYSRAICDYGLQCAFTSSTSGTCKTATKLGAPCMNHFECGFGNYCDRGFLGTSPKCTAAGALGASCGEGPQCASGNCTGGKCTDPNASIADAALCTGVAPG